MILACVVYEEEKEEQEEEVEDETFYIVVFFFIFIIHISGLDSLSDYYFGSLLFHHIAWPSMLLKFGASMQFTWYHHNEFIIHYLKLQMIPVS